MQRILLGVLLVVGVFSGAIFSPCSADDLESVLVELHSKDSPVRYNAARKLKQLPDQLDQAVINELIRLLGDRGPPFHHALQYWGPTVRDAAVEALVRAGEPAVPDLCNAAQSDNESVRASAVKALGKIGANTWAVETLLLYALTDSNDEVRFNAVEALPKIGAEPSKVVAALNHLVHHSPDSGILVSEALKAIVEADPEGDLAIPILIEQLRNPDGDVLVAAASGLGSYGSKAQPAVDRLSSLLYSRANKTVGYCCGVFKAAIRGDVALALGRIGPDARQALPVLIGMMKCDADPHARHCAAAAILQIDPENFEAAYAFLMLARSKDFECLAAVRSEATIDVLMSVVKRGQPGYDSREPEEAIVAIGRSGPSAAKAVPMLAELITSTTSTETSSYNHDRECAEAAIALGRIGAPAKAALPALIELRDRLHGDDFLDWRTSDFADDAIQKIIAAEGAGTP